MFVLAFNNIALNAPNNSINNINDRFLRNSHVKYFLLRINITNYNKLIDGKNFSDHPIDDLINWKNSLTRLERLQHDKEMIT